MTSEEFDDSLRVKWHDLASMGVCLAIFGYLSEPEYGQVILVGACMFGWSMSSFLLALWRSSRARKEMENKRKKP